MIYQVHFKKEHVVLELGQDFKLQRSEESQKKDKVSILIVLNFLNLFLIKVRPHLDYII